MAANSLQLRFYPDPILKEVCQDVTDFDHNLKALTEKMLEKMYDSNGIGLAAPQVGILKQIAVIDISENREEPLVLINPKITNKKGKTPSEEGCLSIPDYRDTIKRDKEISLQFQDIKGNLIQREASGLLAICMQHEIDHLNGILFIDHLSRLKRELFKRWHSRQE